MRVALFGGSFDPPHVGHVLAVAYALAAGGFDKVLVVAVFAHAFDKPLSPFEERVKMTELAMQPLSRAEVSRIEATLGVPSRTLTTVQHLRREHPEDELRLLVGTDVFAQRASWHAFDEIARLAPPFVLGRAGTEPSPYHPPLLPEVSSTKIRELLHEKPSTARDAELVTLVPRDVLEYIQMNGLYQA
jgi:nicotinate-nucleotide adenylyltransferase